MSTPRRRWRTGDYYATAIGRRDDGRSFGRQVARQAPTLAAAARALDATDLPGYIQKWSDETQSRTIVAERDAAGNWWARDPITDTLVAIEPVPANRGCAVR